MATNPHGRNAVLTWSRRIHPTTSDRHRWAEEMCDALDAGVDPEALLHQLPFPSPFKTARTARWETATRLYREATSPLG